MLLKVYDYRFIPSEIACFIYTGSGMRVYLKNKSDFFIEGPKTIFGQFEEQYRKWLSMNIMRR